MEKESNDLSIEKNLDSDFSRPVIIYKSQAIKALLEAAERVATTDSTVLITGESGTGKELIAQIIRYFSRREDKPFKEVNCAAFTESLLESELFGHEKGAFTGAIARKPGIFELAGQGTLFLDEVGELSLNAQAKLLRVVQEKKFERLGGVKTIAFNGRLVAATNRDLEQAIKEGTFRNDLYQRLKEYPIHIPPLRERLEDIQPLIQHFINKFNCALNRSVSGMDKAVVDVFIKYPWPGNVRELENAIRSIITNTDPDSKNIVITLKEIPPNLFSVDQSKEVQKNKAADEMQIIEANKYKALSDWILKDENYINVKKDKNLLKETAARFGITSTKRGITDIGRGLFQSIKAHRELFIDVDLDGINKLLKLPYSFVPSYEKEKSTYIHDILKDWPNKTNTVEDCNRRIEDILERYPLMISLEDAVDEIAPTPLLRSYNISELDNLMFGKIIDIGQTKRGFAEIKLVGGENNLLTSAKQLKILKIGLGDSISFTVEPSSNDVKNLQRIPALNRFALIEDDIIQELAEQKTLPDESWNYKYERNNPQYPILRQYLNDTFSRLREEYDNDNIKETFLPGRVRTAIFNSGLTNRTGDNLYAVFIENNKFRTGMPRWKLAGFCSPYEKINGIDYLSYYAELPKRAECYRDASELLYDPKLPIELDDQIINTLKTKTKSITKGNNTFKYIFRDINDSKMVIEYLNNMQSALEQVMEKLKCDHRIAIPEYSLNGKRIKFLIPLCLVKPLQINCALVVRRMEKSYIGEYIFSLDQAYSKARLVANPHSDWLDPRIY